MLCHIESNLNKLIFINNICIKGKIKLKCFLFYFLNYYIFLLTVKLTFHEFC